MELVTAIEVSHIELAHHGAPNALVERSRQAAQQELRHYKLMGSLAMRFGADAEPSVVEEAASIRSLYEIALENAIEGCVRETYGAVVANCRAGEAQDPAVAAVMAEIADDESGHAGLSWEIAAWLEPQLTEGERERLERAKRDAVRWLAHEVLAPPPAEIVRTAGMPPANVAARLVAQLDQTLWS